MSSLMQATAEMARCQAHTRRAALRPGRRGGLGREPCLIGDGWVVGLGANAPSDQGGSGPCGLLGWVNRRRWGGESGSIR